MMKIDKTELEGVLIIQPRVYEDARGYFYESFNKSVFADAVCKEVNFVQDNQSRSSKGTLRGLHYQLPPKAQGKLVRVLNGEVYDVVVDIRSTSKDFGKWFGITLSDSNRKQLWIPEGFAHGFFTISEVAELAYKTTDYYAPSLERSIIWSDSEINIKWPKVCKPILSSKDAKALNLNEAEVF